MRKASPKSSDLTKQVHKLSAALKNLPTVANGVSIVFEEQVAIRLAGFGRQLDEFNQLSLSFQATETWRTVYQKILETCETRRYLSVALIKSDDYWRDEPGKASLDFNYRLLDYGFTIQRIFIVDPFFWPPSAKTPAKETLDWIVAQDNRGVITSLVRLTDLQYESDLVCDIGIYGNDAVGKQVTDFDGKTVRFELHFDPARIKEAENTWNRIQLYAVNLDELLQ